MFQKGKFGICFGILGAFLKLFQYIYLPFDNKLNTENLAFKLNI